MNFQAWIGRIQKRAKALQELFTQRIWQAEHEGLTGPKALFFSVLRILTIAGKGIFANRIPNQAAALSYASLISLGPFIAISVMISGFVIDTEDEDFAVNALDTVIRFVAPPAGEWGRMQETEATEQTTEAGTEIEAEEIVSNLERFNPQLVEFIDELVRKSRSGTIGVFGTLILIVIAIQLLTTIEFSFNSIWGVQQGRSWVQRIVLYWTLISLGAVIGFAGFSLASTAAVVRIFEDVPFIGPELIQLIGPLASIGAVLLLAILLTMFYQFIPATRVRFIPALTGGLTVGVLLLINNYLSLLYVNYALRTQSLYGSIGLVVILLFGLYIFWLLILLGGQLTHAVQNGRMLARQHLWTNTSHRIREAISLSALIVVCRRFYRCELGVSSEELARHLLAPSNIINQSLRQLADMGLIDSVESTGEMQARDLRYRPARPLNKTTLNTFIEAFEHFGNSEAIERIRESDPLVDRFFKGKTEALSHPLFEQSMQALFEAEEQEHGVPEILTKDKEEQPALEK